MDIGILRDYVISISGILILLMFILTAILMFILYRKIKQLINLINMTIKATQEMGSEVKEAARSAKTLFSIFKSPGTKEESQPATGSANRPS